jgi:HPt (histidine-containing phosphotransfer) domain-containing protein
MNGDERLLDPEALERLKEWGGDTLVKKMVELFFEVAPERMEAILSGVREGDSDAVERGAHSLRSSAGNLGADALRSLAGRIEEMAAAGNVEGVRPLAERLENRFRQTLDELRKRTDGGQPA